MPETDEHKRSAKVASVHAVVDRIEDNGMAVLLVGDDEKTQIDLPAALLPADAGGGDHLRITIVREGKLRAAVEDRVRKLQEQLTRDSGAQEQKDFKL
jgi:hypothetical protein